MKGIQMKSVATWKEQVCVVTNALSEKREASSTHKRRQFRQIWLHSCYSRLDRFIFRINGKSIPRHTVGILLPLSTKNKRNDVFIEIEQ